MASPPGTVLLEDLHRDEHEVILRPQPSSDPNDPLNWPSWRKHANFGLVWHRSLYVVLIFGLINMMPITWIPMALEYPNFTFDILNDSYAAGCGALCIGGVILIPFSLKYGRRPVYILSLVLEGCIAVWSARISNVVDLMMVNILSCFVGALCEIMVQMTVADVYFVHQRGKMNSIYIWTLTIGSSLAPLAAGYVTVNVSLGWRWVWWFSAMVIGGLTVLFFFTYEETKYDCKTLRGITSVGADNLTKSEDMVCKTPSALGKGNLGIKAEESSTSTESAPRAGLSIDATVPLKPYRRKLALTSPSSTPLRYYLRHIYQPFIILATIPAVFYMALLNGAVFAGSIMSISVYSTYMTLPPYNFTASGIGMMGLPSFVGILLGALATGPASDWLIVRLSRRNNGIYEPEMRLWLILVTTPFLAVGYLIFGIGLHHGWSWPIVCIGLGLASFGSAAPMSLSLTYLTDAYTEASRLLSFQDTLVLQQFGARDVLTMEQIIADALVTVTFVRNLFPTVLVFGLTPWIGRVGLANVWIMAVVIFVAILLGNVPFLIWGKHWRAGSAERYLRYASASTHMT